jgi:hypothetical protein
MELYKDLILEVEVPTDFIYTQLPIGTRYY